MPSPNPPPAEIAAALESLRQRVAEVEAAERQHRRAVDALRFVIDATATATGEAFFPSLVRHLAAALQVRWAFVAELADPQATRARVIAFWNHEDFGPNFEYEVSGTPCAHVVGRQLTYFANQLPKLFPKAPWTTQYGAESYLAVPFFDSSGRPLGHIAVMHDGPMDEGLEGQGILAIVAGRAAAELERKRTADVLQEQARKQRQFTEALAALVDIGNQLAMAESQDELCRLAVRLGRDKLGFSRLGIWFLGDDRKTAIGSFGIDEHGQVRDERGYRVPIDEETQTRLMQEGAIPVVIIKDQQLRNHLGEVVGLGARISALMWDGERVIGFLFADDLLRDQPFVERDGEILALYASSIGHLCTRKRVEEALRQSEARFRMLTEHSLVGVYIIQEGKFRYVNPALAQMFGYAPEEMVDRIGPTDLTHPDDQAMVAEYIRRRIEGQVEVAHYTWRGLRTDGQQVECESIGRRIEYQGRPAIIGTVMDITERRRTEQALRESEERFRTFFDELGDAAYRADAQGNITYVNKFSEQLTGRPVQELIGQPFLPLFTEDSRPVAIDAYQRTLAGESPEYELTFTSGRICQFKNQPLRDRDGHIVGLCGIARDVTARKRMEEALRSSEYQYRTTLDAMGDAIHVADRDLRLLLVNRALREWAERFGLQTDMIGKRVMELFPFLPPTVCDEYRQVFETGKVLLTEEEVIIGDHRIITETRKIPIFEGGQVTRVVTVIRDVTERRRLQQQLLQSQKLESIGTLAGGIAHDFNNLLAVIVGNASILQRQDELSPRARELLADLVHAAERGSALTHQLLAYARGGLQKPVPTDLTRVIKSVLQLLERTAPPQITFATDLPKDLPLVVGDPTQLEQVVMNLCLNAIQACEPPSVIQISLNRQVLGPEQAGILELPAGAYLRLQIQDQGCGMNAETLQRAFEPFFTTKPMGRGMGLAAAQGIVHSHHGQIHIDSEPQVGTTVTVWLPAAEAGVEAAVPPTAPERAEPPRGCETILVIDHDQAITRVIEHSLTSLGYCPVAHNDADHALAFLDTNAEDVHLVLLNLHLPGRPADLMLAEIRRRCPQVPIVLTSGLDVRDTVETLKSRGAVGFIQKPFSLMTLARVVRNALDNAPKQD